MASLVLYRLQRCWEKAFKISFHHHLRVAICPFILCVSRSFTKIERTATIERPSARTPVVALQLEHRRWTLATKVFYNGVPLFPMVSYVDWSSHGTPPLRLLLVGLLLRTGFHRVRGREHLKGFWCLLGSSDQFLVHKRKPHSGMG